MMSHPTMRPSRLGLLLLSLMMVTGLLAGCSDEATTPVSSTTGTDNYAQIDFSLPYGGLTASDEAEAFGDESLLAMTLSEEGENVADPLSDDPMVREMEREGRRAFDPRDPVRPHFTYVHLRWGMLRDMMDSVSVTPACDVTDWTGSIRVDRGLLVVRRVIRFERPLDHIIFPRLDQQTVGLVSHTACGYDGVVLQILERPAEYADRDSSGLAPNMLHINLGDFAADIAVRDLAGLERVVAVGDQGNKFAVTGFTLSDLSVCPKGFLSGHYRRLRTERPDSVQSDEQAGERYGIFPATGAPSKAAPVVTCAASTASMPADSVSSWASTSGVTVNSAVCCAAPGSPVRRPTSWRPSAGTGPRPPARSKVCWAAKPSRSQARRAGSWSDAGPRPVTTRRRV